jgi:hypothetical protein
MLPGAATPRRPSRRDLVVTLPRARACALAVLAALAPCPAAAAPDAIPDATLACDTMTLGVQTHFGQGWPRAAFDEVRAVGATLIRDQIGWRRSETSPGTYVLQPGDRAFLARARDEGLDLVLVFAGANPLHDGGLTPHSPAGRAAFAGFVAAVVDAHADAIRAVEIGNEFNGSFVDGPAARTRVASYAALLAAVRAALRPRHPDLPVLGGAAHSVPVGWFRELGAAGALADMDGVVVHPYRPYPEHLDRELARLDAAVAAFGPPLPVFATEFGLETDDPAASAPYLVKMATIMAGSGVCAASWYALRDEQWYRNMGLYDADGTLKPAGHAFALVVRDLLPHGRPERLGDDPLLQAWRFGADGPVVAWGAGQAVRLEPGATVRLSDGSAIPAPARLGDDPIIVAGGVTFGATATVADSLYQYGHAPWTYAARRPDGTERPLAWRDWRWTSQLADPGLPALAVTARGVTAAGRKAAVERFTAPAAGRYLVTGHWQRRGEGGGVRLAMLQDGRELWARDLGPGAEAALEAWPVEMPEGGTLDFVLGPPEGGGAATLWRRVSLIRDGE